MTSKFILTIAADNDAFLPIVGDELARILRKVADNVEGYNGSSIGGPIRDSNGNTVGGYGYYEGDEVEDRVNGKVARFGATIPPVIEGRVG